MSELAGATVVVKELGAVKVHTFIAPQELAANATHIIEGASALVIIDTQFVRPMAQAFRLYADGLGKPIARVFISHAHPDHYFGLPMAFAREPSCTIAPVQAMIAQWGPQMIKNQKPTFGGWIPDEVLVPSLCVEAGGAEVIDGVRYEYDVITGAESEAQLNIRLPELGVHCVQDLVYSGVHLWLGMGWFGAWREALSAVLARPGYDYILAGHGAPCGLDEVAQQLVYLERAEQLFATGGGPEALRAGLTQAFPQRGAPMMFDLYLGFLFGQMSSH